MSKIKISLIVLLIMSGLFAWADDSITLTTYYPAPNGNYGEINAQRYKVNNTPGVSGTLQVMTNGGPPCTIVVDQGLIVSLTCP